MGGGNNNNNNKLSDGEAGRLREYRLGQCEKTIRGVGRSLDAERERINVLHEWKAAHEEGHNHLLTKMEACEQSVKEARRQVDKVLYAILGVGGITLILQIIFKFL